MRLMSSLRLARPSARAILPLLALALLALAAPAMAQTSSDDGPHGHRGLALRVRAVDYSAWAYTETYPNGLETRLSIGDASGFGLGLAYSLHPAVALTAAADIGLYGQADFSAVSFRTVGIEIRRALRPNVIPSLDLSAGWFADSGGREHPIAVFGVALDYFRWRRVAVRTGAEFSRALTDGRRDGDPAWVVTLDNHPERFHLGISWHLGAPWRQ